MKKVIITNKNIGETPLECLERVRREEGIETGTPMTYAGRLDPMAEGVLIILTGEECKNKGKYLGLEKEYEIEILFGIKTDTHDTLGLIRGIDLEKGREVDLKNYVGKFDQEYPMYSSKTVNGKQLHQYARANEEPEEIPTKNVEIYSIEKLDEYEINGLELAANVIELVKKVNGDFRQDEIIEEWQALAEEFSKVDFKIIKLKIKCSSGTYMRSLADRIGIDAGVGAIAYSIKRNFVGRYDNIRKTIKDML